MTQIACAQLAPVLGDVETNLERSEQAVAEAVSAGAEIVVLPELMTSGYMFSDLAEARSAALSAADPALRRWADAAGPAVVVGGFCEVDDGQVFNSAVVFEAGKLRAVYRKTHLWDREKLIFRPGDRLPPVLETRFGMVAVMICYDLEFPEVTRLAAVQGAELIVAPVNWPQAPRPVDEHPGELITAMSAARTNRVALAICDRTGTERGQSWAQSSAIIGPDGWVIAASGSGPGTAMAEVDLAASRNKAVTEYVDVLADRRLDLY